MKYVKVKGFGKFNKAVEDEVNKLMAEKTKQVEAELLRWLRGGYYDNPDEMAFAE